MIKKLLQNPKQKKEVKYEILSPDEIKNLEKIDLDVVNS